MATEAAWLNGNRLTERKKEKVCLDINRPSHGRTWAVRALWSGYGNVGCVEKNAFI